MKRLLWIGLLLLGFAILAALAWRWVPSLLPAVQEAARTPYLRGNDAEGALIASGTIEALEISLASEFGGRIVRFAAAEGEEVRTGQIVVQLDDSSLQAQMAQAHAAVAVAEANLEQIKAAAHPAELLAARASVRLAKAERDAALRSWRDAQALLEDPQQIDARIVEAQAELDVAQATVEQRLAQLAAAEAERERYRAQGTLQDKELWVAYGHRVEAAEAALGAARAGEAAIREQLAALRALRARPLAILAQVGLAEGQVTVAEAGVAVAEARLREIEAGPARQEVRLAQAQVARAQAAIEALQVQVDRLSLRSPIDGIVSSRPRHEGETTLPGAVLLRVASLDPVHLLVYVPLRSLGSVHLGQEVAVRVDAFPERAFVGEVSYIAGQAEFAPGDVQTEEDRLGMVFAVRVRLANPDHLLRPGMAADAEFR